VEIIIISTPENEEHRQILLQDVAQQMEAVTGKQGTRTESRELMAGWGQGLRSGDGHGWDGDTMEGQGAVGDATFRDLDRVHD
jgi:ribosomal protein L5